MTVTGIITAIVVGAIIGALARLVLPGRQNIPIWLTIVVGIVAAFIGTFLARAIRGKSHMHIGLLAPPWIPTPPPAYGGIERVVALLTR
jgi:uncharacterized membrane protein YeaQ/YmgE (transglycosylase-associated protein family)